MGIPLTRVPNVLSIAGSDPSGGAGIQADLKTFAAFDVFGCAVITALTAQNTREVRDVLVVPAHFVAMQLETLFDDVELDAVKVGMLGDAIVARVVAGQLRAHDARNVVVDPVVAASVGRALIDPAGVEVMRDELFPLATLVTPNAAEAGVLLGSAAPATLAEMHAAARALTRFGPTWALVTGGHVDTGDMCTDVLSDGRVVHELRTPRAEAPASHGTGCTLSSAIAALLALGSDVPTACAEGQIYVARALRRTDRLAVGGGRRPLYHTSLTRAGDVPAAAGITEGS